MSMSKVERFLVSVVVCFSLGALPTISWLYFEFHIAVWFVLMFFVSAPISIKAFSFINALPDKKHVEQIQSKGESE